MPLHHVTDFEQPERMPPALRRLVLDEARTAVRAIPTDRDGNLHVSEVLAALDDETTR